MVTLNLHWFQFDSKENARFLIRIFKANKILPPRRIVYGNLFSQETSALDDTRPSQKKKKRKKSGLTEYVINAMNNPTERAFQSSAIKQACLAKSFYDLLVGSILTVYAILWALANRYIREGKKRTKSKICKRVSSII